MLLSLSLSHIPGSATDPIIDSTYVPVFAYDIYLSKQYRQLKKKFDRMKKHW